METAPPIPSAIRPLSDIEGIVNVRTKLFTQRRPFYLRLNGAVLSAFSSATSVPTPDWELSVLHASVEQSSRRHTVTLTLSPASNNSYSNNNNNNNNNNNKSNSNSNSNNYTNSKNNHNYNNNNNYNKYSSNNTNSNDKHNSHSQSNKISFNNKKKSIYNHGITKLYLQFDLQSVFNRWVICLQLAATRDFHTFYHLKDQIGEGAFASVHKAICLTTGKIVAVKKVIKNDFDAVTTRELNREMFAMKHLRHKLIISSYDIFNTLNHVYIVMDYMEGGTMKDRIQSLGGRLQENRTKIIIKQVLEGCLFLHKNGYVHRDIKLENILCNDNKSLKIKIADFGYVNFIQDHYKQNQCLTSLLGTPVYIAPEIIKKYPYGNQVDIYAVGVMLYRMISGHYPYDGKDDDDKTLQLAVQSHVSFHELVWGKTSKKCMSFIKALLNPNPLKRLTAATALLHPWLNNDYYQIHQNLRLRRMNGLNTNNHKHQQHRKITDDEEDENDKEDFILMEGDSELPVSPVTPAEAAQKLVRQLSPAGVVVVPKIPNGTHQKNEKSSCNDQKMMNGNGIVSKRKGGQQNTTNDQQRRNGQLNGSDDLSTEDSNSNNQNNNSQSREENDIHKLWKEKDIIWYNGMTKLKRIFWLITFTSKLGIVSGVRTPCAANIRAMQGEDYSEEEDLDGDEEGDELEEEEEEEDRHVRYNLDNNYDYEDGELNGHDIDDADELSAKAERMESRRRKSSKRASFVDLTRRFGRASSFHRRSRMPNGNGLGIGDRLRRTMTMGGRR